MNDWKNKLINELFADTAISHANYYSIKIDIFYFLFHLASTNVQNTITNKQINN